jgi:phage N-6-adenine-methyltransferase
MNVHFSSATDMWEPPQSFFNGLLQEFSFRLDVCANAGNAKCDRFFSVEQDGLIQNWDGVCWMNPPYGRVIGAWMQKAEESARRGATVVCLVPARTDTAWWHDYALKGEIRFLRGRLKFGGHKNSAPFPSALVIFRPGKSVTRTHNRPKSQ